MELLVFLLVGYLLGSFTPTELKTIIADKGKKIHHHLASPVNDKLELNWTGRQLFLLLSKGCSERWYEARAHLHQGFFKSLICAFGFIYLVRIDLIDDNQEKGESRVFTFHGFQSLEDVMKKTATIVKVYTLEVNATLDKDEKVSYYQTFIAGHNVVGDFMDGSFVS